MGFDLNLIALRIPALLIALTVHEYAHARVAYSFGDTTAKDSGRLTLNPLKHLDPIGTVMLILAGIGWAKPVPINPYRFRDYRSGLLWVSFAGPLSNFILGFLSLALFYFLISNAGLPTNSFVMNLILIHTNLNIILGVFNLIPIPPLDGSKVLVSLAPKTFAGVYRQLEQYGFIIFIILIFTGALWRIIRPVSDLIIELMTNIIFLIPGLI